MYLIFLDSFQLYVLVYVRYMSLDVFPMYLHCIRSLRFFERFAFFFSTSFSCHGLVFLCICIVFVHYVFLRVAGFFLTQTGISCLHPLHVMGWFSYVFTLYTFVTLFERCI